MIEIKTLKYGSDKKTIHSFRLIYDNSLLKLFEFSNTLSKRKKKEKFHNTMNMFGFMFSVQHTFILRSSIEFCRKTKHFVGFFKLFE